MWLSVPQTGNTVPPKCRVNINTEDKGKHVFLENKVWTLIAPLNPHPPPPRAVIKWSRTRTPLSRHNNYPWTQFNTNSTLSSSLFPLNTHVLRHKISLSLSLSLQKAQTPTYKWARSKQWKAWIIWAKVNWSHPAVLFLEKAASYTKEGLYVWERLRAPASPCLRLCYVRMWWRGWSSGSSWN